MLRKSLLLYSLGLVGLMAAHVDAGFILNPSTYNINGGGDTAWVYGTNTETTQPGDNAWTYPDASNPSLSFIRDLVGNNSIVSLYKYTNDGNVEEGSAAGSYTTTHPYSGISESGKLAYDGAPDPIINPSGNKYLLLKDGNLGSFIFDISSWNGMDDIIWENFWPASIGGSGDKLSHFDIFSDGGLTTPVVPEPGGLSLWLAGLVCIAGRGFRRRRLANG